MSLKKVEKLKNLLQKCKESNDSIEKDLEENIILGFYEIPENEEKPTVEEKQEILRLVSDVSKNLINYAKSYKTRFYDTWEQDEELTCRLHSGFQYLKDDYIDPLKDRLEPTVKDNIFNFLKSFDYDVMECLIENWKSSTECYKPLKPEFVPDAHFWWNVLNLSEIIEIWKDNAYNYLKQCYDNDFDQEYEFVKGREFCQVIGCAVYGEQADGECVENDDSKFGFCKAKTAHILKIQQKICDLSPDDKIRVFKTMIHIFLNDKHQGPTIAFKFKSKYGYVFIDASCRIYKSWTDFKQNNKLPECQVAYPCNGTFEADEDGKLKISFEDSPACSKTTKVLQVTDVTASVVGIGTTCVALAGLAFPLTAPVSIGLMISGGATGLYGAGRSGANLADRSKHEESISLADSEARLHWLNVVTAPLAIAGGVASVATSRIAASGQVLSKTAQVLVNTTIFGSFGMTSVNVVNNLVNLIEKAKKDELTKLDVTSFVISVAFWTNSAMNLQTAQDIIKTTQKEVLNNYQKDLSKKEARQFKRMVKNTRDETAPRDLSNPMKRNMHDDAKAIRAMHQINEPKEFLQSAIQTNKEITKENKAFTKNAEVSNPKKMWLSLDDYPGMKEYNGMSINNELKIAPQKFRELAPDERQTILKATIKYINDGDEANFLQSVSPVKGIKFEIQKDNAINGFCSILKVKNLDEYRCNGKKLFENLKPNQKNRLVQVENTLKNGTASQSDLQERQIIVAVKFAEEMEPKNASDFMNYLEYAIAKQKNEIKKIDVTNKPTGVSAQNFKSSEYLNQFFDGRGEFKPDSLTGLKNDFNTKLAEVRQLNKTLQAPFASDIAATYHVEKHGNMDAPAYMNKINQVIENAQPNKVSTTQEGNATYVSYVLPGEDGGPATQVYVVINSEKKSYTTTMFERKE